MKPKITVSTDIFLRDFHSPASRNEALQRHLEPAVAASREAFDLNCGHTIDYGGSVQNRVVISCDVLDLAGSDEQWETLGALLWSASTSVAAFRDPEQPMRARLMARPESQARFFTIRFQVWFDFDPCDAPGFTARMGDLRDFVRRNDTALHAWREIHAFVLFQPDQGWRRMTIRSGRMVPVET